MEKHRLPLYAFFDRLRRETGLELDMQQYFDFLKTFTAGYGGDDPETLLALCKIHWLPRPRYRKDFERLFWEEFEKLSALSTPGDRTERKDEPGEPERKQPAAPLSKSHRTPEQTPPSSVKETPPLPERKTPAPVDDQYEEILIQFREAASAESLRSSGERAADVLDNDFLFSDKYLSLSDRRLQQHWRYLRARAEKQPGARVDVPATVEAIACQGGFIEPVYQQEKVFRRQVMFLTDHGGSMAAFETIARHLMETIRESLQVRDAEQFYFHNFPSQRLFRNRLHTQSVPIGEFLRQIDGRNTLLLIISDAGAARGTVQQERINQTKDFLALVKAKSPNLLWLNPMPRARWRNSSAGYISYFVPMLEASKSGLRKLPEVLKRL